MPFLSASLCRGQTIDLAQTDIVDDDFGVVVSAPLLDERFVEPGLEAGDKILPAHDPQRFALCPGTARNYRLCKAG